VSLCLPCKRWNFPRVGIPNLVCSDSNWSIDLAPLAERLLILPHIPILHIEMFGFCHSLGKHLPSCHTHGSITPKNKIPDWLLRPAAEGGHVEVFIVLERRRSEVVVGNTAAWSPASLNLNHRMPRCLMGLNRNRQES